MLVLNFWHNDLNHSQTLKILKIQVCYLGAKEEFAIIDLHEEHLANDDFCI